MKYRYMALALATIVAACDGGTDASLDDAIAQEASTKGVQDLPVVPLEKSAEAEGFEVTVNAVEQRSQIGIEGLGPAAGAGETFIVVRYSLKNLGKKPVSSWDFPTVDLMDSSSQVYAGDSEASALESALSEDITGSSDLNPNITAKLVSVWKIHKASFDESTWRMKISFGSAIADAITWPLDSNSPPPLIFALK